HRRDVDAGAVRRYLVLADRTHYGACARLIEPPQACHDDRYHQPDKHEDVEGGPAMLREVADLAKSFGAVRTDLQLARLDLVGEIEEEQTHGLAEGERRDHQHQPFHA